LRPELGGTCSGPPYRKGVMDLPAGEADGCRHFFTNGGLGCLGGAAPRIVLSILTCLDPPGVEAFLLKSNRSGPTRMSTARGARPPAGDPMGGWAEGGRNFPDLLVSARRGPPLAAPRPPPSGPSAHQRHMREANPIRPAPYVSKSHPHNLKVVGSIPTAPTTQRVEFLQVDSDVAGMILTPGSDVLLTSRASRRGNCTKLRLQSVAIPWRAELMACTTLGSSFNCSARAWRWPPGLRQPAGVTASSFSPRRRSGRAGTMPRVSIS
jgi:hypothetical protein